jgi:hypothetical protein
MTKQTWFVVSNEGTTRKYPWWFQDINGKKSFSKSYLSYFKLLCLLRQKFILMLSNELFCVSIYFRNFNGFGDVS